MGSKVSEIFEKEFQYQGDNSWILPSRDSLYTEYYQFSQLQHLKEHLNAVKSKLNNYTAEEWNVHTKRRNPAAKIPWYLKHETKAEFVTTAWCKFFECLKKYPLVKHSALNSLHLCEAPGAFVAALNHMMYTTFKPEEVKWCWLATALNPYYEGNQMNQMISDDRLIKHTFGQWIFHDDFTGNIINTDNIRNLEVQCQMRLGGNVQLITADGSVGCDDNPGNQEECVSMLQLAEIVTALRILNSGGSFVIKMFTMFESSTACLIYLFCCSFESVQIFKPATSKHGNSEVYVICVGYKKDTLQLTELLELMFTKIDSKKLNAMPLFSKSQLPQSFLSQHEICCQFFTTLQIQAIESNICTFKITSDRKPKHLKNFQEKICMEYFSRYDIKPLSHDFFILNKLSINMVGLDTVIIKDSYTQRKNFKLLDISAKIFHLRKELNEIIKIKPNNAEEFIFKGDENPTKCICIYKGASILNLNSSTFCGRSIMHMRLRLLDLFNFDPILQLKSYCIIDDNTELTLDYSKANGQYHEMEQSFFVQLLQTILTENPSRLVFKSFPFLTHYNHNFEIILSVQQDKSTSQLTEVVKSLNSHLSIHGILEICELHQDDPLINSLILFNDGILIEAFKRLLKE